MYEVIKSVITAGGYKLAEIQHKVKKLYILGDITEEQVDELLALAAGGVSTEAERPENLELILKLAEEIATLKARVKALEDGNEGGGNDDAGDEEVLTYAEWKPWDGISKDYQKGAIVTHNGQLWQSVFSGQNVWEPGTAGTESLWTIYEVKEG